LTFYAKLVYNKNVTVQSFAKKRLRRKCEKFFQEGFL